ncbi:interferon alpha-G-like [Sander vitreus]
MVTMATLLVLLQLCSIQLMADARPTCSLPGKLVQSAHHLLRDLGGPFPAHCLRYNSNISFPYSAFPAATANHLQCRQTLWVVYESLQEADLMFEDYDLPVGEGGVTWDDQTLTRFRHLQNRLLEGGACLSSVDDSRALSSYFSNVTAVIQQQDSAACGWTVLRRDLTEVLKSAVTLHKGCFTWTNKTTDGRGH